MNARILLVTALALLLIAGTWTQILQLLEYVKDHWPHDMHA